MSELQELELREAVDAAMRSGDGLAELEAREALNAFLSGAPAPDVQGAGEFYTVGELPEFDLPFEYSGRQQRAALGLLTTFDDKREVDALRRNYPDLKFMVDQNNNIIVDGRMYGGNVGYLNAPGLSQRDLLDAGFQMAAFTPAAKVGQGLGMTGRMATVGSASAGTQALMDLVSQQLSTGEMDLGEIDETNVAYAGVGGAAAEPIAAIISPLIRKYTPFLQGRRKLVYRKIREDLAEALGINPGAITDDMVNSWIKAADEAVEPAAIPGLAETEEFGIPYTVGQSSGDTAQLRLEDSMRQGVFGEDAADIIRQFEEGTQQPAIEQAVRRQQDEIAGGKSQIDTTQEAGEMIRERVSGEARALDTRIGQAYDAVGDAFLGPENFADMLNQMRKVTRDVEFVIDNKLAPATKAAVDDIDRMRSLMSSSVGKSVRPFHIKKLEALRRRLNAHINLADNAADRRQVLMLKNAFDDYLDAAVDGALFSGDDTALASLKQARELRTEYGRKFERRDRRTKSGRKITDQVGDVVERIVWTNPTDEQVVNYMFGATKFVGKDAGGKIAARLKEILGPDSPEWQAVREAGFLRLTAKARNQVVQSGRKIAGNIDEALERNRTLMKELYSDDEILEMRRLARAIKRAQPEIFNPSRTSYAAAGQIRQMWERLATMIGYTQGGIAGAALVEGAQRSGRGIGARVARKKAESAVRGSVRPFERLLLGPAGATAGTAIAEQPQNAADLAGETYIDPIMRLIDAEQAQ